MGRLWGFLATVAGSAVGVTLTLLVIRHIGPLQRLAGLVKPEKQLLPFEGFLGGSTARQDFNRASNSISGSVSTGSKAFPSFTRFW